MGKLFPRVVNNWRCNSADHAAISSGPRYATLSAYVGQNHAEFIHVDECDEGPRLGLRCSPETPQSPTARMFVYPEMMRDGKRGVIIRQPIGTVTLWKASRFQHTGSVDELALLRSLKGMSDKNDPFFVRWSYCCLNAETFDCASQS